jgi:hypothetical protein
MRMLMAKDRDIRMMVVYGYSRLVGYDEQLKIVPDILEKVDDESSRVFTLHLRPRAQVVGRPAVHDGRTFASTGTTSSTTRKFLRSDCRRRCWSAARARASRC